MRHGPLFLFPLLLSWVAFGAEGAPVESVSSFMEYQLVHPMHRVVAGSRSARFVATRLGDGAWHALRGEVAVADFDSGNANRDSHALEVLEAPLFPKAEFRSTWISNEGGALRLGGILRFHGVENPLILRAALASSNDRVHLTGTFALSLTAFKVKRPALFFVPVQDELRFKFHIQFPDLPGMPTGTRATP